MTQRLAFSRWVGVALLALLGGCMTPPPPELPATLHIPADTPEEERAVWELAAREWNEAAHAAGYPDVIAKVTAEDGECGIHVVPGTELEGTNRAGWARVTGPCRAVVMLRPDIVPWDGDYPPEERFRGRVTATHELGHILQNERGHSANPLSVMFGSLVSPDDMPGCDGDGEPGADLLAEDVAAVLARMPGGGR